MARWIGLVAVLSSCTRGDTCSPSGGSCNGGLTCTRDGECLDASEVRAVKVVWTIGGMPASAQTCGSAGDFMLIFLDPGVDQFGYAPVPCAEGQFTIDKIPTRFTYAQIAAQTQPIGADGTVGFAL